MTVKTFTRKLLRLSFLRVQWFEFQNRNQELHLGVKPYKNGCRCPKCGRRGKIIRILEPREWRDIVVCGIILWFHYAPKEIECEIHGRIQEEIPWAASHARVSYRLELVLLLWSQRTTQKAASQIVKLAASTLSNILHRTIHRYRDEHRIRGLRSIGVDEISYRKGKKYATIVYDLDRACVVWVGQGKGKDTIDEFFRSQLSPYQRAQIKTACCDVSRAYMNSIQEHCPNVSLVLDHFHIVQTLNQAVDEVRKEAWREASDKERKVLRGMRWLLAFSKKTRTKGHTRKLNLLESYNRRIFRAWLLKDNFDHFWQYVSQNHAANFLKTWITRALRSRLQPMKNVAFMLRRHTKNILSFIENPLTNARAEGINRILRMTKNRASGFRNLENFTDMIFLVAGDLDIPGQFSKQFCTT